VSLCAFLKDDVLLGPEQGVGQFAPSEAWIIWKEQQILTFFKILNYFALLTF